MSQLTDEELVDIIRTSNKEQYREVVNRYQAKLYSYARYITKDDDKAKDAVQQTFIKAYQNLNNFDTNRKFSSWIYRITHNESINVVKKYNKETELPEFGDTLKDKSKSIETLLEEAERNEAMQGYIEALPVKYREVIVLFFIEERSYEEISDILRIPIGTVGVRISRGKERLKQIIVQDN